MSDSNEKINKIIELAKKEYYRLEKYVVELIKKGILKTRILTLWLKKNKAYYYLGKDIAKLPPDTWTESKSVLSRLEDVQIIDEEIDSLKGKNISG